jgi:hypothetical protein
MPGFSESGDRRASRSPTSHGPSFDFGRAMSQERQPQIEIDQDQQSTETGNDTGSMIGQLSDFARDLRSTMYGPIEQYRDDQRLMQQRREEHNTRIRELEQGSRIEECYKIIQTKKEDGCLLQSVERTFSIKYEEMMQQRQQGQVETRVREELVAMENELGESVREYISYRTLKAREAEGEYMLPADTRFLRTYESRIPEELRQPAPSYNPSLPSAFHGQQHE